MRFINVRTLIYEHLIEQSEKMSLAMNLNAVGGQTQRVDATTTLHIPEEVVSIGRLTAFMSF